MTPQVMYISLLDGSENPQKLAVWWWQLRSFCSSSISLSYFICIHFMRLVCLDRIVFFLACSPAFNSNFWQMQLS